MCDSQEESGAYVWYQVTAPSGLTLRPGINTARLDAIPFGEEVFACSNTSVTETIEGKTGVWIKVTWADKPGYVFSGFLQKIRERKIRMVIPNAGVDSDWGCMELSPEIEWNALVNEDTSNIPPKKARSIYYTSTRLKIGEKRTHSYCSADGYLKNAVLNVSRPPFAIFSGFELASRLSNHVKEPIKLMPGEVVSFSIFDQLSQLERRYLITVEGNVIPSANFMEGGQPVPLDRIEHYKINLYQQEHPSSRVQRDASWRVQKLVDGTIKRPGDTSTYEMDVSYVIFAGDLDGDHQLDLILARLNGVGRSYQLFLSSRKLPGFLLRYVARWRDSSC